MKNNLGWAILLGLLSAPLYAEEIQQQSAPLPPANDLQAQAPSVPSAPIATAEHAIDCHFKIAASAQQIDLDTLHQWAQNAITKSFDFSYNNMDSELNELKSCFTENGWQSFNDALIKSGNVEAIKNQQLTVNSQLEGQISIVASKQNQWRISAPLQVVYQNNQEKVLQQLNIEALVGRKSSGDLGIMQIVATPRENKPSAPHLEHTAPSVSPAADSSAPLQQESNQANQPVATNSQAVSVANSPATPRLPE